MHAHATNINSAKHRTDIVDKSGGELISILRVVIETGLILILFALFSGQLPPDANESHYLTKAKHAWDTSWCSGDLFLSSSFSHWLFYALTGWLNEFLTLSQVAWVGRFATWTLIAFAWQRLNESVSLKRGMSVFSAALFLLLNERFHLAGEWVVGGFEAKGFAYGFVILALASFVKRKPAHVWILLGVATAFHVLVGGWAWIAVALALMIERYQSLSEPSLSEPRSSESKLNFTTSFPSRANLTWFLIGIGISLVGVVPPLIADQSATGVEANAASLIYVNERIAHHLNFAAFPAANVVRFLALTLAVLWAATQLKRRWNLSTNDWRRVLLFAIGSLVISFSGMVLSGISEQGESAAAWSYSLLRFYWFRLADFAVPASLSLACCLMLRELFRDANADSSSGAANSGSSGLGRKICIGVFMTAILGATTAMICERYADIRPRADRLSLPTYDDNSKRTIDTYENWKRVCFWARDNTSEDAVFITPAAQQTFKWYAGRTEVVCWKDVPQDAAAMIEWRQRVLELYEPQRRYETGLMSYSDDQLRSLAQRYKATHMIVPQAEINLLEEPTTLKQVYPVDQTAKSTYVVFEF